MTKASREAVSQQRTAAPGDDAARQRPDNDKDKHDAAYFRQRRRAQGIVERNPFTTAKILQRAAELRHLEHLPSHGFGTPVCFGEPVETTDPPRPASRHVPTPDPAPISLRLAPPRPVTAVTPMADPAEHVQAIANRTICVSRALQIADPIFRLGWDAVWIEQLGDLCRTMKTAAQEAGRAFHLQRALPDALIVWWQDQDCVTAIGAATKAACAVVQAQPGGLDFSDATTVLRGEYTFAITLQAIGGLSSLERMDEVLTALAALAEDYHRYPAHDNGICPAIVAFVRQALPLILTTTHWLGAEITNG